ncbi:MAG: histone deacetylase [Planctomycetota bacterium]|nr:MAG: histone deacetylase [Planctomycetota bacterium]
MARASIVYRRRYNFGFPGLEKLHPFDMRKFAHAMSALRRRGALRRGDVRRPRWPSDLDLQRVHWRRYLKSVRSSETLAKIVEVPFVARLPQVAARYALLHPMRWAVGGTMLAARLALERGSAVNLGGGFHHAHANRGHGFCVFSDVAVAIAVLRAESRAQRFLIVDLDAHQGDGHSALFADDEQVEILDMFNDAIFPGDSRAEEGITWDVRLEPGTGDREYLARLEDALPHAIDASRPDLAFYLAGTDVIAGDPLGLLDLSPEGLLRRDRFVWEALAARGVPRVMLTAGGYTQGSAALIASTVEHYLSR